MSDREAYYRYHWNYIRENFKIDNIEEMVTLLQKDTVTLTPHKDDYFHGSYELENVHGIISQNMIVPREKVHYANFSSHLYGGKHYVSVSKNLEIEIGSSFLEYTKDSFVFVLDKNLNVCKTILDDKKHPTIIKLLSNSSLPVRFSSYMDEFQVKGHISLDKCKWIIVPYGESEYSLKRIGAVVEVLDMYNSNIPLVNSLNNQEIDKELVKHYVKSI